MSTKLVPEINKSNKYWISKHRYYELKHFCLQYPDWKKKYYILSLPDYQRPTVKLAIAKTLNVPDPTGNLAVVKTLIQDKIRLVEEAAMKADDLLYTYILKAVTEEASYVKLKTQYDIPCGKGMFYDRYRKFFWILSSIRN